MSRWVRLTIRQAGVEALRQYTLIQFAPDEHQLRFPRPIAPRPMRAAVDDHMHALNNDAFIRTLKIQESLHAIQLRTLRLQRVGKPCLKSLGIHRTIGLDAERADARIVRVPG